MLTKLKCYWVPHEHGEGCWRPSGRHPPFLSLAPWIMSTRVSAQGGTWSAHVAAGGARWPLSLSAAPTSDAWARREVPQLLWPPPGGRAAPGHSHPQLAWPQLPAALTCSLMHTWHPCLHFLTCPSPVSASWDHLPSKLLGLVTLSHDKLLEEHSLWHSPPNTHFFFSFFLKNQNPNTWGRDSKPSPRTWIVSGISQTGQSHFQIFQPILNHKGTGWSP